jgi:CRP-like cAMP-binding protein
MPFTPCLSLDNPRMTMPPPSDISLHHPSPSTLFRGQIPKAGLASSRIGIHLGDQLARVEQLGCYQSWAPGDHLCCSGHLERTMHVLIKGHVSFPGGTFGPGAHTGEIGFVLGVPRTADVVAVDEVTTWTIPFDALPRDPVAATALLGALSLELPSRIRKFQPTKVPDCHFCDFDHPAIAAMAELLRAESDAATARAIWSFVSAMPYRFGIWWQRASETLKQGWGMCTTKSNLEVALFRAAGLEAGFIEIEADSMIIRPIIPDAWQHAIKPGMKHFMGAVKLDGRWHAADSSFTKPILQHFAKQFPHLTGILNQVLDSGNPFHPAATIMGADLFDVQVIQTLDRAMASRSSHDIDRLEVMNLVVDGLQGPVYEVPAQLLRARELLAVDPHAAFFNAMSVASSLATGLRNHILEPA